MAQKKRATRATKSGRRGRAVRGKSKTHAAPGGAVQFEVPALDTLDLASSMDRVAKILARAVGEVARTHKATAGQMYIVAALSRAPQGLTAKHLASALAIRPGSLTGMLDTLEKRGVLRRERVPGDGRQQNIVLVEGAGELVNALAEVDNAVSASLVGLDDGERARLRQLSEETEAALRTERALPMPKQLRTTGETETVEPAPAEATVAASAAPAAAPEAVTPAEPTPAAEPAPKAAAPEAPAPAVAEPKAEPYVPPPKYEREPDNKMPPPRADDPGLARNLFSLSSRVLSAVDAQIRKRRDS